MINNSEKDFGKSAFKKNLYIYSLSELIFSLLGNCIVRFTLISVEYSQKSELSSDKLEIN